MLKAVQHPYLVSFDSNFKVSASPTKPPEGQAGKKLNKQPLRDLVDEFKDLQKILYAHDHHGVLLVFQAMDAAGKDSTIRAVMSGVNPAGFQTYSFKKPSSEELDHDFLWRTSMRLPERGRVGIFNRSYYEEVLVTKVHSRILDGQKLPGVDRSRIFESRYASICDHERHLAENGYVVLKFWLNVSKEEQRQRFLSRLNEPEKNWKFAVGDVEERKHWDQYMLAYQAALNATSRPWAPWYAIPADDKPYMRRTVAQIIVDSLKTLNLVYPQVDLETKARFDEMRRLLENEDTN